LLAADARGDGVAYDVLSRAGGTGGGIQAPGVAGVRIGVLEDPYWAPPTPWSRAPSRGWSRPGRTSFP
jgi:aspartyl-tRNA(Asn)/glutamyl-tRNA(Gln) amidotransferase subunit A